MEPVAQASFDDLHLPKLAETKKFAFRTILSIFSDVFVPVTGAKNYITAVKHTIPTKGLICQLMRQHPDVLRHLVQTEVQHELENGAIRLSKNPWSSPSP